MFHSTVINPQIVLFAEDTSLSIRGSDPAKTKAYFDFHSSMLGKWFLINKLDLNSSKSEI